MKRKINQPSSAPTLYFIPSEDEIREFARHLNTPFVWLHLPGKNAQKIVKQNRQPLQDELRRLTQAWFHSGPNTRRLFNTELVLAQAAERLEMQLIPTSSHHVQLRYITSPKNVPLDKPQAAALELFLSFLLSPFSYKLAGPCKGCNSYYVKNTKRQNTYCSSICGRTHTSRKSNRARAQQEKNEKIRRAQDALQKWNQKPGKKGWKESVSKTTGISKNLLTRTAASGELCVPANAY